MESPFRIVFVDLFRQQVAELATSARRRRRRWKLKSALDEVNQLLIAKADQMGDPLFRFRGLDLEMRQVVRQSSWFLFGVKLDKRTVFLKQIKRTCEP